MRKKLQNKKFTEKLNFFEINLNIIEQTKAIKLIYKIKKRIDLVCSSCTKLGNSSAVQVSIIRKNPMK